MNCDFWGEKEANLVLLRERSARWCRENWLAKWQPPATTQYSKLNFHNFLSAQINQHKQNYNRDIVIPPNCDVRDLRHTICDNRESFLRNLNRVQFAYFSLNLTHPPPFPTTFFSLSRLTLLSTWRKLHHSRRGEGKKSSIKNGNVIWKILSG